MKKNTHTILAFVAAAALVLGAFLNTGCQALSDFAEEHPIAYNFGKGAAEVALTLYLGQSEDSFVADNREALLFATNSVFAQHEDPANVALELTREIDGIFPDDPAAREALLRNMASVLRPDPSVPASGPETRYKVALAAALAP